MKKFALALASLTILAGSTVQAQDSSTVSAASADGAEMQAQAADAQTAAADGKEPIVLNMPNVKSNKRLLFSFGLFGTGVEFGWRKARSKEEANVQDLGVGRPIMNFNVGRKQIGLK